MDPNYGFLLGIRNYANWCHKLLTEKGDPVNHDITQKCMNYRDIGYLKTRKY